MSRVTRNDDYVSDLEFELSCKETELAEANARYERRLDELIELRERNRELESLARGMFKMIATSQALGAAIERDSPRALQFAEKIAVLEIEV